MKTSPSLHLLLLAASLVILAPGQAAAPSEDESITVARSVIKADRQAVVTEALRLNPAEAEKFWPIYHQYRAEMDKVADGLVRLVDEYAMHYPDVPADRAKAMLKDLTNLEKKQVATRASFLKKTGKVLPAVKNLRFAQVESRLDIALRLAMAAKIPFVPVEGEMTATGAEATLYADGVPGGVIVQTRQLTATVAAMDRANRKLTLVDADGIKQTVKAGPAVVNYDQIQVGDQLKVRVTEELVVQMAKPGDTTDDRGQAAVVLAPKGAKPGGLAAGTVQVTATVTAIDPAKRTATLRFEDGSTKTFPVRSDVDLRKRKTGEKVVFRVTEMIALSVEKP